MLFNVSCDVAYKVNFPSTLILSVHAQRNASQTVVDEQFSVEPKVKFSEFTTEGTDNRFVRIETGEAKELSITYRAGVECDFRLLTARKLEATPVAELTGTELTYL